MAALVRWGPWMALGAFAGMWGAWIISGLPPALAGALAVGSTAGGWIAAEWLRRQGLDRRLEQFRDLTLLLGASLFGSALLSAANGAAWLVYAGRIPALDILAAGGSWWLGESLAALVLGIPLLTTSNRAWRDLLVPPRLRGTVLLVGATLGLLIIGLSVRDVLQQPLLPVLLLAPVLLGALSLRRGLMLASSCLLVLAAAALWAGVAGFGPFQPLANNSGFAGLTAWVASLVAAVAVPHVLGERWRKQAERMEWAVGAHGLAVADWNLRSGTGFTSARWHALLEPVAPGAVISLERWLQRVHPDDRAALAADLWRPDGEPARRGADGRTDIRLWVREQWRWFDLQVSVAERDESGAPARVLATVADAGAKRRAQDRDQLSSSLFLNLREGLLIADADMVVLDANPTYCRILGLAREEVIGKVPTLLRGASSDPMTRTQQATLWAALQAQGHWAGELMERRRNGDACALHLTVSAVHGPQGSLRYHVLVVSDITEQRVQREKLERQAHFDELTQLPNRARLSQLLAQAMAATDRDGHLLTVCFLDIDHFKAVNERLGHAIGDRLLQEMARRMESTLRDRASWSDAAARLGGDEFVLLLRASTVDEARAAVERVLKEVSRPYAVVPGSDDVLVSASMGATIYPLDRSDADTLLRHADNAMFGAKQAGRNGYLFFDSEHSRRTEERVMAIGRVQDALDRGELLLYYQPKVDLRRGVVTGVEALLRWNHPEHGVVAPAHFLPLIEHTGLSARIGDHVMAKALDQLDRWQHQGLDLSVSVNVSARHLQEPDFAQRLAELLARHSRPLGPKLELEILETAALLDVDHTSAVLERCTRLGVRCALDDFGTGYSTLTYLKRLPIHVLKIDRSFVRGMLEDAQDRAIVEGIISLARTFECVAVAEGVETAAQARALLDLGCDIGQGAGIASPMPAGAVAEWMRQWRGLFSLASAPAAQRTQIGE